MLEKLNQLRLCPAVSTFTEAKEWIAIFEGPSEWFETEKEFENYAEKRKIENHASAEEVKAARTTFFSRCALRLSTKLGAAAISTRKISSILISKMKPKNRVQYHP